MLMELVKILWCMIWQITYLDGTTPLSPQATTIATDNDTYILQNLEFHHKHLQDQMILSAILISIWDNPCSCG